MSPHQSPAIRPTRTSSSKDGEEPDHGHLDSDESNSPFDTAPAVRYLTRRCGDRQLAEDIAQDALETILMHDTLRQEWTSLRLLFRVALNEFSNHQRKAAGRSVYTASVPSGEFASLPEASPLDIDLAIDVRDALARLPPEARRLILLYWEGYSYNEMAERLRIPVSALRMRLMRAKGYFVEELAEYRQRKGGTND